MSLLRLIARLDIKGPNVVKGIRMEGLRVVGKPDELATCYAQEADELLYIDTVATLYGRNQLTDLLARTTEAVFIPVTVAGGIQSGADADRLFRAGADKVAINTAALRDPSLLSDIAGHYGSQAVVLSIEAKRNGDHWEAYTDNGRERTGRDVIEWAHEAVERGVGEILATSVDQEGTRRGFDLQLIRALSWSPVPLTACGGMGRIEHAIAALDAGADALAFASVLHYDILTVKEINDGLVKRKLRAQATGESGRNAERPEG